MSICMLMHSEISVSDYAYHFAPPPCHEHNMDQFSLSLEYIQRHGATYSVHFSVQTIREQACYPGSVQTFLVKIKIVSVTFFTPCPFHLVNHIILKL